VSLRRFDLYDLIAISLGGAFGAALRWSITSLRSPQDGGWFTYGPNTTVTFDASVTGFAWDTLIVNVLGCLVLGAATALAARSAGPKRFLLAVGTGFCGSLTTFSTFAVDVASGLRDHVAAAAVAYLVLSVAAGGVAFALGRAAAHRLPGAVS